MKFNEFQCALAVPDFKSLKQQSQSFAKYFQTLHGSAFSVMNKYSNTICINTICIHWVLDPQSLQPVLPLVTQANLLPRLLEWQAHLQCSRFHANSLIMTAVPTMSAGSTIYSHLMWSSQYQPYCHKSVYIIEKNNIPNHRFIAGCCGVDRRAAKNITGVQGLMHSAAQPGSAPGKDAHMPWHVTGRAAICFDFLDVDVVNVMWMLCGCYMM